MIQRHLQVKGWVVGMVLSAAACSCSGVVASTTASNVSSVHTETGRTVLLSPGLEAGWVGWCMSVRGATRPEPCADVRSHRGILAERWTRSESGKGIRGSAVTSGEALAVLFAGGAVVPTQAEPGLPGGLRAAVVEVAGSAATLRLVADRGFAALNDARHEVRAIGSAPLGFEVPSAGWHSPAPPLSGMCSITTPSAGRARPVRGGVVSQDHGYPAVIGQAFETCAATEYSVERGRSTVLAGMLIDARHPGGVQGPIPQMRILNRRGEIYTAPTPLGRMLAKRMDGAWLFVASGPFTRRTVSIAAGVELLNELIGRLSR